VVGEVAVASSIGVKGAFAVTHAWCYSVALATEDGQSQMGYSVDAARALDDLDIGPVAREAAHRAVRMLGAAKPPTRTVPVVFDRMVAPSLLGVLLAGLSAEEVQKRRSLFADRIGEPVRAATVAAHLLDILKGIEAVGSDLRFTTGSIGGSSLLIGEMTVAGA
jgi:PmbA protein